MPLFHYALVPGGVMMLGSSESVGDFAKLFATIDRKAKIFQRRLDDLSVQRTNVSALFPQPAGTEVVRRAKGGASIDSHIPLLEIVERTVMRHYSPVGALVTERGDILYLLGRTGEYLEPAAGNASMNIFRMAREGLRSDLTIALHRAASLGVPSRQSRLRVKTNGDYSTVNLTVLPVPVDREESIPQGLLLVIIEPDSTPEPKRSTEAAVDAADAAAVLSPDLNEYIIRLKHELRAKDEHLQTAIEELETSNEELRSAHEEMQSVNEEMQSTNEELETSKEELQSLNEELSTVNGELQSKVTDLSRINNDMKNLLGGTGIATVFVDHSLCILRFTPAIAAVVSLIESDIGRPVDQIRSTLVDYDQLAKDVKGVLDSLVPKELEVATTKGEWYLLRIRPYRTLDNIIEGAVITFTEITAMKKAQAEVRDSEALRRLAVVVRDVRDAILVQDTTGKILAWNPGAERIYGWSESEALAMNFRALIPKDERESSLAVIRKLSHAENLEPQVMKRLAKDGKDFRVSIVVSPLVNEAGELYAIATTERLLTS